MPDRAASVSAASAAATVGYELLCAVAPRVPHVTSDLRGIDLEL